VRRAAYRSYENLPLNSPVVHCQSAGRVHDQRQQTRLRTCRRGWGGLPAGRAAEARHTRLMTLGKLSEQRKPPRPEGEGCRSLMFGSSHRFAALCRHNDFGARKGASFRDGSGRFISPQPPRQSRFSHPRNHGGKEWTSISGFDVLRSSKQRGPSFEVLASQIRKPFHEDRHFQTSLPGDGEGGNHDS